MEPASPVQGVGFVGWPATGQAARTAAVDYCRAVVALSVRDQGQLIVGPCLAQLVAESAVQIKGQCQLLPSVLVAVQSAERSAEIAVCGGLRGRVFGPLSSAERDPQGCG